MSKYTLEQQSHAEFQANRPVSATIEPVHRVNQQIRPSSEILAGHYKSPEAEAIDRWFEDLSYYERTLEQMAKAKLDDNFREELKAIEQWFSVLTDPERTTALYSLLQHTTQVQIRFFITVLQQMAQKDPVSVNGVQGLTQAQRANMSGVPPGIQMSMNQKSKDGMSGSMGTIGRGTRRVFDRHSAPPTDETYGFQSVPFHGSDTGDEFEYKRSSVQSGSSSNRNSLQPLTPVDPINSANWSVPVTNPAPGHERSNQRSSMKLGNGSVASIVTSPRISGPDQKSANSPYAQNISPRPLSVPSSPILNNGMSQSQAAAMLALAQQAQSAGLQMNPQALMNAAATIGIQHPGSGWGHVDITPGSYSRPSGSPTGYARSDFSDSYDYESADNSSTGATGPHPSGRTRPAPSPGGPHKEKGKIPETIDLEALKDIPGWLRSLRLHKYTPIFENMDWKEMIKLTDEELSTRGVAALGARRKMIKVFDMVKKDLENRGISY